MKVGVISWGSPDDCTPMISVARELKHRGHNVRLVVNDSEDKLASKSEFPDKRNLAGDYNREIPDEIKMQLVRSGNVAEFRKIIGQIMKYNFQAHAEQIIVAMEGMDIVIYTALVGGIVLSVADNFRIPCISVALQPQIPTCFEPPLFVSKKPFSLHFLNDLAWAKFGRAAFSALQNTGINPFRERLGLPAIESKWNGLLSLALRHPLPMVCAYSPELSPLPPDAGFRCPGSFGADYPFSDQEQEGREAEFQPSEELLHFLEGSRDSRLPVYIGWGSMTISGDRSAASALALRALRASGQRGVLMRGEHGISVARLDPRLPDFIYLRAYAADNTIEVDEGVPHSWLFPRCAAAVHHGGSGTTHTALRAGIPNIITPFWPDQSYWGYRCYAMGIGPRAPKFRKTTWKKLGHLIASTVHDEAMCQRATEAGARAKDQIESGAVMVVRAVESSAGATEFWTRYFDNGGLTGPDCWREAEERRYGASGGGGSKGCLGGCWWPSFNRGGVTEAFLPSSLRSAPHPHDRGGKKK